MHRIKELLEFNLFEFGKYQFDVLNLALLILIIILTYWVLKIIKRFIFRHELRNRIEPIRIKAQYRIIKYVILVVAITLGLEAIGVEITILLASSAALLVGVGMGIQRIFLDIVSGFVILFGRHIKTGDVIEVDKIVGKVLDIGIRTSRIITPDDIDMIIPNSKFITENLINWSYNNNSTMFHLKIGVAYESDVSQVEKLLLDCAMQHPQVSKLKKPFVRFTDFGDSQLCFELLFWCDNMIRIENVLSDLRFMVFRKFKENGIVIPFPQRELFIRPEKINVTAKS
jgi:small-conductance mechanosensitive channel